VGVPKRITSKAKRRSRRAAKRWKPPGLFVDPETGNVHLPHSVDPATGRYRGRQVITKEAEEE
jgi:large subunit ribosomal protein L32